MGFQVQFERVPPIGQAIVGSGHDDSTRPSRKGSQRRRGGDGDPTGTERPRAARHIYRAQNRPIPGS